MPKLLLVIIVICLVALLLVGCGVQPQTPANQPAQGDGDNNTEVNTDKDPEQGDVDNNTEVNTDKDPEQGENGDQNGEVTQAHTRIVRNYGRGYEESRTGRIWIDEEAYVLSMRQEPTLDKEFQDNRIFFSFRYYVEGDIGFDYFADIPQIEIAKISYLQKGYHEISISPSDNAVITIDYSKMLNIFYLTLAEHYDKQTIIDTCRYLMDKEEVLIADPIYISYTKDCTVVNNSYYSS